VIGACSRNGSDNQVGPTWNVKPYVSLALLSQ